MKLQVPFNTKARIVLTKKELTSLTINGAAFDEFKKNYNITIGNNSTLFLGSGKYEIQYLK